MSFTVSPRCCCSAAAVGLALALSTARGAEAADSVADHGLMWMLAGIALVMLFALLLWHRAGAKAKNESAQKDQAMQTALYGTHFDCISSFVLPHACDGLVQIDHAVLTSAGIVCIRTKHIDGIVHGSANDPQWRIADKGRVRSFLNPVIQNEGRVTALRRLLPDIPVASLVVASGNWRLADASIENVIPVSQAVEWLRAFESAGAECGNRHDAWQRLRAAALTDEDTLRDFRAQLSFG